MESHAFTVTRHSCLTNIFPHREGGSEKTITHEIMKNASFVINVLDAVIAAASLTLRYTSILFVRFVSSFIAITNDSLLT